MAEDFKIYIDRLRGGHVQKIEGAFNPSFLDVDEKELQFDQPVAVRGDAYLTDDHLVIHLSAATMAEMPCSVCNKMIKTPLTVGNFYHTEPLSEIRDAIYDFQLALREALLIELPHTVECNKGRCPSREILAPYMRGETRPETYFPFADIDLKK
jgi:uncharacterized metal-binding protein YceD (DUF177 family)